MIAFLRTTVYSLLNTFALLLIAFYRAVGSLWLSGSCRYEPSCSVYAQEAIERYGFWVGGKLAIGRLLRCRPGSTCGYDPVPDLENQLGSQTVVEKVQTGRVETGRVEKKTK
jgi:putative membrane protein insertion efficiency factor